MLNNKIEKTKSTAPNQCFFFLAKFHYLLTQKLGEFYNLFFQWKFDFFFLFYGLNFAIFFGIKMKQKQKKTLHPTENKGLLISCSCKSPRNLLKKFATLGIVSSNAAEIKLLYSKIKILKYKYMFR
jgi:hypothetical protein